MVLSSKYHFTSPLMSFLMSNDIFLVIAINTASTCT